ncbi:MAG: enoyl-CoA hydratase [Salinisphaeraceae bacterium]|jgi:2-(1,2-epoxy-1,2-dihydrophenyl)acetyl-CoA isomerase|nr:enoyl-CoA hydratase [Salinisphaeraceae bacterium]
MSQVLEFDIHERIATLTLNRPDQHNAFNDEMIALWTRALEECLVNDDVRCVVVTGAGKTFCSGGDLQELRGDIGNAASTQKAKLWEGIHGVAKALHRLDKPVIAAVNGAATGAGMDMALWCDLRFAADSARFAETYVKVGLVPGDGGAWLLPRLIGTSRALELLLTGDFISAERALELGLVNRVYPAAELLEQTYECAGQLARGPRQAMRIIKRAVYQSHAQELHTHLDMMSSHMGVVMTAPEHAEGVAAFLEKRAPRFE